MITGDSIACSSSDESKTKQGSGPCEELNVANGPGRGFGGSLALMTIHSIQASSPRKMTGPRNSQAEERLRLTARIPFAMGAALRWRRSGLLGPLSGDRCVKMVRYVITTPPTN